MRIDGIEIYTGTPEFEFTAIRRLEVKCEASNAMMPAPTIDEANGRLRALAAKVGANAIIDVDYKSGVSMTSWKSLKATGLAVTRISDEITCDVCAETIKRAALKCRYCGAERDPRVGGARDTARTPDPVVVAKPTVDERGIPIRRLDGEEEEEEPLRDNNNPAVIIALLVVAAIFFSFVMASA